MFVWNAFSSLEDALSMLEAYDPYNPDPAYNRLRKVKYSAAFKPIKDFALEPGFERLWRIKLNDENAFAEKMVELEAGIEQEKLELVNCPIGLDIGAERPEEIAIAVIAEILAAHKGVNL